MSKIATCLLFDRQAEEAARFYVDTFRDGSIDHISHYGENMPMAAGTVLLVAFTLFGQSYQTLNCGAEFAFTEAVSLSISCADQAEVDRLYEALTSGGGSPGPCGWVKDRFGLSWQIVPEEFVAMQKSSDAAAVARAMQAMMTMQKLDLAVLKAAYAGEG
jgi:predicted 3-demethylubiquinone-9 3-methyltransferase (glyoxalase superfamily)